MTFGKDLVSAEKVPWFQQSAESSHCSNAIHIVKWSAV